MGGFLCRFQLRIFLLRRAVCDGLEGRSAVLGPALASSLGVVDNQPGMEVDLHILDGVVLRLATLDADVLVERGVQRL